MEVKKKSEEMDASLSIKLPQWLLDKARTKSAETGVSISFKVRKCLEAWVKEKGK